jgi:hypothetical protein
MMGGMHPDMMGGIHPDMIGDMHPDMMGGMHPGMMDDYEHGITAAARTTAHLLSWAVEGFRGILVVMVVRWEEWAVWADMEGVSRWWKVRRRGRVLVEAGYRD